MKLSLTEEQREIVRSIRNLFARECPPSLVRQLQDPATDPRPGNLWDCLTKAGVFGLAFSADLDGHNTFFNLGLVYEQGGRSLCPTIIYSTIEFGLALSRLRGKSTKWLLKVAAGDVVGTISLADPNDSSNVVPPIHAERQGTKWVLSGSLDFVPNADVAEALLTTAQNRGSWGPDSYVTILVRRPSISAHRRSTFARDNQCRVDLTGVKLDLEDVFTGSEAFKRDDLYRLANATTALHCMDMVGGAQAVIDRTVAYVKDRYQFGRPIASFQAVQHHVANMHVAVEGARLAAYQAIALVGGGRIAERETAIAKLKANEAYKCATMTAHQLHGGIGILREFDLHLWSERAKAMELRHGAWDTQIRRLSSVLNLSG
ncbi:acyl-CoA dehydrogenase family protein [Bradyrhizobium elkanii]|uniref:acyl-CoA dehydrogenase family protein n=1 Tax=Bradyrhizobium elkanii TaxID=29448 RepID=UPI001BA6949F|nr:acyl-CoA dehydrogenase family protein [Bradyrhizobium elkanii]MBR1164792.1 acyl-CoA/acyl-ACP dehydrogenase [Bradyrhizobium elkanii]